MVFFILLVANSLVKETTQDSIFFSPVTSIMCLGKDITGILEIRFCMPDVKSPGIKSAQDQTALNPFGNLIFPQPNLCLGKLALTKIPKTLEGLIK